MEPLNYFNHKKIIKFFYAFGVGVGVCLNFNTYLMSKFFILSILITFSQVYSFIFYYFSLPPLELSFENYLSSINLILTDFSFSVSVYNFFSKIF